MEGLVSHDIGDSRLGRQDLILLPTPESTDTHKVVPHSKIVEAVIESLAFRRLDVVADSYVVNKDATRFFGVLEINEETTGVRFALGIRNSLDKSLALGLTVGYRVFVCSNLAFHGEFTPITRRHSKNFDHIEVVDSAVAKMQRYFAPMRAQIDAWQGFTLPDMRAKSIIFDAFIGRGIDCAQHIGKSVAQQYFEPEYDEFKPRTMWSLSNAFTSAFKELEPIPQMRATSSLAPFLAEYN